MNHTIRFWKISDEHMIEIAKHCNKLQHVELQFNSVITENGLLNGLFAYCAHLESLQLYNCHKVLGSFLETMPITIKRLAFVSVY